MARGQRYTIGQRIEHKFLDLLELTYLTYFTERQKKAERIVECVFTLDTLKYLLYVAWESKLMSNTHYAEVAQKLDESGKMFGGWQKSLHNPEKKNRIL